MKGEARIAGLANSVHAIASASGYPDPLELGELAGEAILALSTEDRLLRPRSGAGRPGGLVRIDRPFVAVVPDLHGRVGLLDDLLRSPAPNSPNATLFDLLASRELSLLCLGDILNTEGPEGADRWRRAARRLSEARDREGLLGPEMDEEMGASLRSLQLVMTLKARLPEAFHCLKGNHDNIGNVGTDGDAAFYKYALEGAMGAEWFRLRYGEELGLTLRRYERLLPLVASGKRFCASHAEPAFPMSLEDLLEYGDRPDVVRGLIWTENGEAREGSVIETMRAILGPVAGGTGVWLAGHRPVRGNFSRRAGGRLLQFHNPERRRVAWIDNRTDDNPSIVLYEMDRLRGSLRPLETLPPIHLDQRGRGH